MTEPPSGPWSAPGPGGPSTTPEPPPDHGIPSPAAVQPPQPAPWLHQSMPGHHFPPPPPRRPAGVVLAIALGCVVVLALGVVAVVALNRGSSETSQPTSQTTNVPTTMPPPSAPSTTETYSHPPPSTAPSSSGPQKILKLADHPILQDPNAGLKNLSCYLPAWQNNQAAVENFFTAAVKCLDAAWGPFLEAYDLPFVSPTLHFPTGASFDTACGTIQVGLATAAYYCENNLYVPYQGLQTAQYGNDPGVYLALIAHEYGHHVQEVAGIMDAVWQQIYQVGPASATGLEMSRRKELQAQCFSGMFLGAHVDHGSVTRDMYNKAWNDQETRGDTTSGGHDHGTNAHYAAWWRAGATNDRISDCNTFAAPSSDIS